MSDTSELNNLERAVNAFQIENGGFPEFILIHPETLITVSLQLSRLAAVSTGNIKTFRGAKLVRSTDIDPGQIKAVSTKLNW